MEEQTYLNLKKVRLDQGHTLRSLAEAIGVHYSLISYWETGKKKPRRVNLMNLEKELGVSGEELFKKMEE